MQVWGKLSENLTTGAAWADGEVGICNDGDAAEVPLASCDCGAYGHALRAHGESEAQVLDIAAGEDRSVFALESGPHGKSGVGGVGVFAGFYRKLEEVWVVHVR